jgi:hypothetical protein
LKCAKRRKLLVGGFVHGRESFTDLLEAGKFPREDFAVIKPAVFDAGGFIFPVLDAAQIDPAETRLPRFFRPFPLRGQRRA